MRFLTLDESSDWITESGFPLDTKRGGSDRPNNDGLWLTISFPKPFTQVLWLVREIEAALRPYRECLILVTQTGVFPSSEYPYLYDQLRRGYHDTRSLHGSPGHLCLEGEGADVVVWLYVCALFGWDAHVYARGTARTAFFSHDGCIDLRFDSKVALDELASLLSMAKVRYDRA